jgi:3-methylfumaryl-CoA hydratase
METTIDLEPFRAWMDRTESVEETPGPVPALCLAATLNLPSGEPPAALPPLWHWLHFLDRTPSSELGEDGSPRSRSLLPPLPLEQVMWAGSEITFEAPLLVGHPARKTSRIVDMVAKTGSRGPMVFLTHEHRFEQQGRTAIVERTRAVFLGAATGTAAPGAPEERPAARQRQWPMDEATLFRFSALTFNTHRIHYDHPYATRVGGYPGLVVHGPLQALLLAETFRGWHPEKTVRSIAFRARASLYCGAPVSVCAAPPEGARLALWTRTPAGGTAMECTITAE